MNKFLALAALSIVLCGGPRVDGRTWTDSTGQYTVEADFVDLTAGIVRLRTDSGSIIRLPLEKLSVADQRFVKLRAKKSPPKARQPDAPKQGAGAGPIGAAAGAAAKKEFRSRRVDAFVLASNMLYLGIGDEATARRNYPCVDNSARFLEIEVPVSIRELPAVGDKNAKFPLVKGAVGQQFLFELVAVSARLSQRHGPKVGAAFLVGLYESLLVGADLSAFSAKTRKQWLTMLDQQGKAAGVDQKDLSEFADKLKALPGAAERKAAGIKFLLQVVTKFAAEDKKEAGQ